ncbi:MAG: hypothetical protein JNM81_17385 [Rhodospirillaceae bacterium]|nr:hypothetical protein [Rhodospirillaceae bacterium]
MSTATVVNTNVASTASTQRMSPVRGGSGATSFQSVDSIDTQFAAQGREDFRAFNETDDFDFSRPARRGRVYADQVVRFSGVFVSREVGTTIVQAQAAYSRLAGPTVTPSQAERNVAEYEFNQALMGPPEVTTAVGMMH